MAGRKTSLLALILIALPVLVFAIQTLRTEPSRKEDWEYKEGDYIPLFANTAFPNKNPWYFPHFSVKSHIFPTFAYDLLCEIELGI